MTIKNMMCVSLVLSVMLSAETESAVIRILVTQDVALNKNMPDTNQEEFPPPWNVRLIVSSTNAMTLNESMFGFDMSMLSDLSAALGDKGTLQVNSITFSAFRMFGGIHSSGLNPVHIALGNTDSWDSEIVTWNFSSGDYGPTLDIREFTQDLDPEWASWNVSGISPRSYQDGFLTFYLFTEPLGGSFGHNDQFERGTAFLSIDYEIRPAGSVCLEGIPISKVVSLGGAQKPSVNETLSVTFTGHIMETSGLVDRGRNRVDICPGTLLLFEAESRVGTASCTVNGQSIGSTWIVEEGDAIVCSNRPQGADTDRFFVR